MPEISNRGAVIPASPIRMLTPLANGAKARGVKVYHLNIGQPDLPSPQKGLDALKTVTRKVLEYSPSEGFLSLRRKLASYYAQYGIHVGEEEIIVTSGGSEAVLFAFLACLNPGDEIIMTEPGYANYMSFAITAGVTIRTVTSRIEDGFALPSVEEFEAAITPKTRAILLCNPNNPTGYLYSREELMQIRDIVLAHDLYLFSDEVYREFIYTGTPYVSAMHLPGIEEHVIMVDSVSKRYSECGIRIGALVTRNHAVREAVLKLCQARLSPPLLGQIVAEASIEGTADYSRECFLEYLRRRNFFIERLNRIPGVHSPMPQGAFYTVAQLPVDDAEAFCKWCLSDFVYQDPDWLARQDDPQLFDSPRRYTGETVMMAPAAGFYQDAALGRDQVRLAYVLKREDLERALTVLEKALESYNAR